MTVTASRSKYLLEIDMKLKVIYVPGEIFVLLTELRNWRIIFMYVHAH